MKNIKLIAARKEMKLSQEEVSKLIKVANKSVVCNWEHGRSYPTMENAIKLSSLYGKDINYLFGDYEDE